MTSHYSGSLYSLGLATRKAFQKALCEDDLTGDDTRQRLVVENERFELWATNLGLFVAGHGSLDYRVRQAENIKEMLQKFLSALISSLTEVLEYIEAQTKSPADDGPLFDPRNSDDGWDDDESDMDLLIGGIRDPVDRLYKLSTWIRNPSSRFASAKALQHTRVDLDTHIDLLEAYRPFDESHILSIFTEYQSAKSRAEGLQQTPEDSPESGSESVRAGPINNATNDYSHANSYLVSRLARANFRRRQQFSYWKRHREKLSLHSLPEKEALRVDNPAAGSGSPPMVQHSPIGGLMSPLVPQSVTTATMLKATQQFTLKDDRSTVSVSVYQPSMYRPGKELVQFPRPPSIQSHEKYFECPFCFTLCPKAMLAEEAWKAHLIHDIRPYVCTYQDCKLGGELYDTRQDWLQHENSQHRQVFRCPDHTDQTFESAQDYHSHIQDGHMKTKNDIPQRLIVSASESTFHLPDRCCPICDITLETQSAMQSHVARHLERIALFAVPSCVDENEENTGGQGSDLADIDAQGSRDDDFEGEIDFSALSASSHPWSPNHVQAWLIDNGFSNEWQKTFTDFSIHEDEFLQLGELGMRPVRMLEERIFPHLLSHTRDEWERAKIRSEGSRLLNLVRTMLESEKEENINAGTKADSLEDRVAQVIRSGDRTALGNLKDHWTVPTIAAIITQEPQLICQAVSTGRPEIVEMMLDMGCPVSEHSSGDVGLNIAIRFGYIGIAQMLLHAGVTPNTTTTECLPAMLEAAGSESDTMLRLLLDMGGDVNFRASNKQTPLIHAARLGQIHNVKVLITAGADIYATDAMGRHALMEAAIEGFVGEAVVVALLEAATSDGTLRVFLDVEDHSHRTVIIDAIAGNNPRTVQMLIQHGATLTSHHLFNAIRTGNEEIVDILIDAGANVDIFGLNGRTPLIEAAEGGKEGIVRTLVKHVTDPNTVDGNGQTAMFAAAGRGHTKSLEILFDGGADGDRSDTNGRRPLMRAAKYGHDEATSYLLSIGAAVDSRDLEGQTALFKAANAGHATIVSQLVEAGARLDLKDKLGRTALWKAAKSGHAYVLTKLLDAGASLDIKDNRGLTALWIACSRGKLAVATLLIDAGAVVMKAGNSSQTPFVAAAASGHEKIVATCLLKVDLAELVNINPRSTLGLVDNMRMALTLAADGGHVGVIRTIWVVALHNYEELRQTMKDVLVEALGTAAEEGHEEVVQFLLEKGVDIDSHNEDRETPLLRATMQRRSSMVMLLLRSGADPAIPNKKKMTALEWGITHSRTDLVKAFLSSRKFDWNDPEWARGLLFRSIEEAEPEVVKVLIDSQRFDLDIQSPFGQTAVSHAAHLGKADIVRLFLETFENRIAQGDWDPMDYEVGFYINKQDISGRTALAHAARKGHSSVVGILLDLPDIDVNIKDVKDRSPILHAARKGHYEVILLLRSRDEIDLQSQDSHKMTPLSWAAWRGHVEVVAALLLSPKVDPTTQDVDGWEPLTYAAAAGHLPAVKLLLDDERVRKVAQTPGVRAMQLALYEAKNRRYDEVYALLTSVIPTVHFAGMT